MAIRDVLLQGTRRHGERGQTLPFWVAGVLLSFGLTYFSFNYANSVRWQIRAQNAADSAAAVALGQDAALANSMTTLEYATNIQNLRDRSVNNDISALTSLATSDQNCSNLFSPNCAADYAATAQTLSTDTALYDNLIADENQFVGQTTDIVGSSADATALVNNSVLGQGTGPGGVGCIKLNTDCGFVYKLIPRIASNGQMIIDSYACRKVPTAEAGIIGMVSVMFGAPASQGQTFYAIGHSSSTLGPASTGSFDPATQIDPLTNTIEQPAENINPNFTGSANTTIFNANLTTSYLVPKPAPPGNGPYPSVNFLCN